MKKLATIVCVSFVFFFSSCRKNDNTADTTCKPTVVNVSSDITTPTVWEDCHVYVIGLNQINVRSTLTIQPGAIVKFKDFVTDNAIIVYNSGKIIAEGTAAKPIIFTSYRDDEYGGDSNGNGRASFPARFDWGGIIVQSNNCTFKYCKFLYGGEGAGGGVGQPTLEFASYNGIVDHCTFAYCGGEATFDGYGVVDGGGQNSFSITNSTFYGCIKPMNINPWVSVDNSNSFHNPADSSETNQFNGIFIINNNFKATSNLSWLETEVPFVVTGGLTIDDSLKLILGENVIIKMANLTAFNNNRINIREGSSSIEGKDLSGVLFTSYFDDAHGGDTNGDGAATVPYAKDWYGIMDLSATIPTNNHCYAWPNILYAKYP